MRVEPVNRLKLKRADLCHADRGRICPESGIRIGIPDIANHIHMLSAQVMLHNFPEKRDGRRFSVCPRDGHDSPFCTSVRQLDLSPDRDPCLPDAEDRRDICRHPRAHDAQVQLPELFIRERSEHNRNVRPLRQGGPDPCLIQFLIAIIQYRSGADVQEQSDRANPALPGPDNQYILVL